MIDQRFWDAARVAGLFLVLGAVADGPGVVMFWIRGGHRGGAPPSPAYFVWERSFIMAALVLTAIAFVLLEGSLSNSGGRVLARTGATAYLFAAILLVAAEALSLSLGYEKVHALIAICVVLSFLAQTAIGASLLQSGVLSVWIGWSTIVWNRAWLVGLPLITPRDIYFPVLHHLMPLLIGGALLWRAP